MAGAEPVRIILVSGSVMSGIGKGIVASSLGVLLKSYGYRVSAIKIDPYLNVDAGTFSPFEHGEVFVLDDGSEVDLDLGNYERFLDIRLRSDNNITSGKIYLSVINRERRGNYLGKTVQTVPHITNAIIEWVERVSQISVDESREIPEICIVELGGTIGDIEVSPYTMAFNRASFNREPNRFRFMSIHVTKLFDEENGEIKTKPCQDGLRHLFQDGLVADLLICRTKQGITEGIREKISEFARLETEKIVDIHDVPTIYSVPLMLQDQNVVECIRQHLKLPVKNMGTGLTFHWNNWTSLSKKASEVEKLGPESTIKIALVVKYMKKDNGDGIFTDAYASVVKAIHHAALELKKKVEIKFINAEYLVPPSTSTAFHSHNKENSPPSKSYVKRNGSKDQMNSEEVHQDALKCLHACHGILVPGGFGDRGIEGKIAACKYARENKIPFLGICLGLQCAAIEFARNVCGIKGADSTEFCKDLKDEQQIVIDMPEHAGAVHGMGGTMRCGRRTTVFLTENSILKGLYGASSVDERHRHRYEVNPAVVPSLCRAGLMFVGMGVDEDRDPNQPGLLTSCHRTRSAAELINMAQKTMPKDKDELLEKIEELCLKKQDSMETQKDSQEVSFKNLNAVRMEIAEMCEKDHPYFVGVQYHPEFLSHPTKPSPPFYGLLLAASKMQQG